MSALKISPAYQNFLKGLINNPLYFDILMFIKENGQVNLEALRQKFSSDDEKLREDVRFLVDSKIVNRDGNIFSYQDVPEYYKLENFLLKFSLAKQMYYDQVSTKFQQRAYNIIIMQEKLNERFDNLNKYSDVSADFRKIYKKSELFKKSAAIAFQFLSISAFEVYAVEEEKIEDMEQGVAEEPNYTIKKLFHQYTGKEEYSQTEVEKKYLQNALNILEPQIINAPQENSLKDKRIFAVFPLLEEGKASHLLFFGFDGKAVSMIKDSIIELLDGFSLNFRLTLKTADMIQVLEDKVAERTKELRQANMQLKEVNSEISDKNKSKLKEIEIGANIQRTVVPDPKQIPKLGPLSIGAIWVAMPMKTGEQEKVNVKEVSGDFYNYYKISEDEVGIMIADASGHGIPAALLTMMASAAFSFNSRKGGTTAEICSRSNKEIYNAIGDIGYYLTAFYIKINLKTLDVEYTNAGHHKAIVYRAATGELDEWDTEGFFIGSFQDVEYGFGTSKLYPGDKIIMTTDGIEEARNEAGEFFEEDRLINFIKNHHDLHAKDFCDRLYDEVELFTQGYPANDDRTVVVIDVGNVEDESANVLLENITTYSRKQKYQKAKKEIFKYIKLYGEDLNILLHLGDIYYQTNELDKSEEVFMKAKELFPKEHYPLQRLSKVAYAKKEFEKSAEYSQEATKLITMSRKKKK